METNTFNFELVSPERKLMSDRAFQVTIPAEAGVIGVRAGHMPLLVSVRPGVVEILRTADSTKEKIFISGGFADISQENCTLLAEEAIPVSALNMADLSAEKEKLLQGLPFEESGEGRSRQERRIQILEAMIDAAA